MITQLLRIASVGLMIGLASCGDTQAMQDDLDASICEVSFLRDSSWMRIPAEDPQAIEIHKQFLAGAEPVKSSPANPVWFSRKKRTGIASCRRSGCDAKYCYFHVQLYNQEAGQWKVSFEYDLAPRKVD